MAIQTFIAGQALTAAQQNALNANDYNQTVNTSVASYVLVASDKGTRRAMNAAGATTITVDTGLFAAGDTLIIQNIGAGTCTITAGTATVASAGPLAIPANGSGTLYFTSTGVSIYFPSAVTGQTVQTVNTTTGAVATGTTIIPFDDTIPQITEGDQYMTRTITPRHASNILVIQIFAMRTTNITTNVGLALFVGTTANALAAMATRADDGIPGMVSLSHSMVAGVTTELTFRVRMGNDGTLTFNGRAGARFYGGVMASSITITEYTP